MTVAAPPLAQTGPPPGVLVAIGPDPAADERLLRESLDELGLIDAVRLHPVSGGHAGHWHLTLTPAALEAWVPGGDTLGLAGRLPECQPGGRASVFGGPALTAAQLALKREIAVALLAAPYAVTLPGAAEWRTTLRVRRHIAQDAARTRLAFETATAERPMSHWVYDEDLGFLVRPGCPLIEALTLATQPAVSGRVYDFSCYRATEYVILLGIAQTAEDFNLGLLERLQTLCEHRVVKSRRFHELFLIEWGSMAQPVAQRHWVPGDRTWFRNPDPASSDASGYEGSWTIYLGGGLFANFWCDDEPFTLERKCHEIFHWRHALWTDIAGEPRIDEREVLRRVAADSPAARTRIVERMSAFRDPSGVYAQGGCIDTTREAPRWISPGLENLDWSALET